MQESQDWCLQCGAGARGNVRGGPGWRAAALAFGSAAILALGAAAAAVAALKQSPPHPKAPVAPVAQTPTTSSTTSSSTSSSSIPSTVSEGLPEGSGKPPKIPTSEPTPSEPEEFGGGGFFEEEEEPNGKGQGKNGNKGQQGGGKHGNEGGRQEKEGEPAGCEGGRGSAAAASVSATQASSATQTSSQTTSQTSSSQSASASEAEEEEGREERGAEETEREEGEEEGHCKQETKRAPILLDTNAASTYDPNGYPEASFGDPSLAIDGESTTSWTAPLAPEIGPLVQSGLLLDLKAQRRIAKVTLIASTPGMSVQVYGTTQRKPPSSLNSVAWVKLSHVHVVAKRKSSVELRRSPQKIRQLLVWIVKAPEGDESIAIGEAELYEPK